MKWLREHILLVTVATLGLMAFALFTWSEYGYFCDQSKDHQPKQPCAGFWSKTHLHDWIYNAASNWQSELLFGILLVVLLHKVAGPQDGEKDET